MYCPNCNTLLPDDAKFCGKCGTIISEVVPTAPVEPAPAPAPAGGYRNPAGGGYRDTIAETEAAEKFNPKSLVSMILGIASVAFLSVATLIFWLSNMWTGMLMCGLLSLPLGIVAVVLSTKNNPDTTKNGQAFRKVGKITGMVGLIASAVMLAVFITVMIVSVSCVGCALNEINKYGNYGTTWY